VGYVPLSRQQSAISRQLGLTGGAQTKRDRAG
jgi:hypothetical protein